MPMSAYAIAREDGHAVTIGATAPLGFFVSRATALFAGRDRTRVAVFFTRTGSFFNEILRSVRSTLSRYCVERAGVCGFLTRTAIPPSLTVRLAVLLDPAKELPRERLTDGVCNRRQGPELESRPGCKREELPRREPSIS